MKRMILVVMVIGIMMMGSSVKASAEMTQAEAIAALEIIGIVMALPTPPIPKWEVGFFEIASNPGVAIKVKNYGDLEFNWRGQKGSEKFFFEEGLFTEENNFFEAGIKKKIASKEVENFYINLLIGVNYVKESQSETYWDWNEEKKYLFVLSHEKRGREGFSVPVRIELFKEGLSVYLEIDNRFLKEDPNFLTSSKRADVKIGFSCPFYDN